MPIGLERWAHSVHWGIVGICVGLILVLLNLFQIVILARWAIVLALVGPMLIYEIVMERLIRPIGSCTLVRRRDR